MGTTFQPVDKATSLKSYVVAEYGNNRHVHDFAVVGSNAFLLADSVDEKRMIVVLKLTKHTDENGFHIGEKAIGEDMGPFYYDCPLRLLDAADEPANENAAQWRAEVRRRASARNRVRRLKKGDRIKLERPLSFGRLGTHDTFQVDFIFHRGRTVQVYRPIVNGEPIYQLVRVTKLHTREFEVL